MNKTLTRIAALLLIPCLIAEPSLVYPLQDHWGPPLSRLNDQTVLETQALSVPMEMARNATGLIAYHIRRLFSHHIYTSEPGLQKYIDMVHSLDPSLRFVKRLDDPLRTDSMHMVFVVKMPNGEKAVLKIAGKEGWRASPESFDSARNNLAQETQAMRDLKDTGYPPKLYNVYGESKIILKGEKHTSPVVDAILKEFIDEPLLYEAIRDGQISAEDAKLEFLKLVEAYRKRGYALYDLKPDNLYYPGRLRHADMGLVVTFVDRIIDDDEQLDDGIIRPGYIKSIWETILEWAAKPAPEPALFGFSSARVPDVADGKTLRQKHPELTHLFSESSVQTFLDQLTNQIRHIPEYEFIRSNPKVRLPSYLANLLKYYRNHLPLVYFSLPLRYPVVNIEILAEQLTEHAIQFGLEMIRHDYGHIVDENGGIVWKSDLLRDQLLAREVALSRDFSRQARKRFAGVLMDLRSEVYRHYRFPPNVSDTLASNLYGQVLRLPVSSLNDDQLVQIAQAIVYSVRVNNTENAVALRAHFLQPLSVNNSRSYEKVERMIAFLTAYVEAHEFNPNWMDQLPTHHGGAATTVGDDITPEQREQIVSAINKNLATRQLVFEIGNVRIYILDALTPFDEFLIAFGGLFGDPAEPTIYFSPKQYERFLQMPLDAQTDLMLHELGELENAGAPEPLSETQLRELSPITRVQEQWKLIISRERRRPTKPAQPSPPIAGPDLTSRALAGDLWELNRQLWTQYVVLHEAILPDLMHLHLEAIRKRFNLPPVLADQAWTEETRADMALNIKMNIEGMTRTIQAEVPKVSQDEALDVLSERTKDYIALQFLLAEKLVHQKKYAAMLAVLIGAYSMLEYQSEIRKSKSGEPRALQTPEAHVFNWFGEPIPAPDLVRVKDGMFWQLTKEFYRKFKIGDKFYTLPVPQWIPTKTRDKALRKPMHIIEKEGKSALDVVMITGLLEVVQLELDPTQGPIQVDQALDYLNTVKGWSHRGKADFRKKYTEKTLDAAIVALENGETGRAVEKIQEAYNYIHQRLLNIRSIQKSTRRNSRKLHNLLVRQQMDLIANLRRVSRTIPSTPADQIAWLHDLETLLEQPSYQDAESAVIMPRELFEDTYALLKKYTTDFKPPLMEATEQALQMAITSRHRLAEAGKKIQGVIPWFAQSVRFNFLATPLRLSLLTLTMKNVNTLDELAQRFQAEARSLAAQKGGKGLASSINRASIMLLDQSRTSLISDPARRVNVVRYLLGVVMAVSIDHQLPWRIVRLPLIQAIKTIKKAETDSKAFDKLLDTVYVENDLPQNLIEGLQHKLDESQDTHREIRSKLELIQLIIRTIWEGPASENTSGPPPSTPGGDSGLTGDATNPSRPSPDQGSTPNRMKFLSIRELVRAA